MKVLINRTGRRKTEAGFYYNSPPLVVCINPTFEPKIEEVGCGGCTTCTPPDKAHVATIPLKKLYHPCQPCIPCGAETYEPGCDNFKEDCCKECCK